MIGQIKRQIAPIKLIKHPNVIHMYEVMASKTKIYIVMELVTGGELFDKIRDKETEEKPNNFKLWYKTHTNREVIGQAMLRKKYMYLFKYCLEFDIFDPWRSFAI